MASWIRTPKLRSSAAMAGAVLVLVSAAVSLLWLQQRADESRRAETILQRLIGDSHALESLEGHAASAGDVSTVGEEMEMIHARMLQDFARAGGLLADPRPLRDVRRHHVRFMLAFDRQLVLVGEGRLFAARTLEEGVVEPAREAFESAASDLSSSLARHANRVIFITRVATVVVFLGAVALLLLLTRQASRARVARSAAEAEARLIGVYNEQLRELDGAKDDFVAAVSHELRTPLTSIRGYLELVLEGEAGSLTEEQTQFLGIADRNSARLLGLIGDLLFVGQLNAGKLDLEPAELELHDIVVESVESAQPAAAAKAIELSLDAEPGLLLHGDRVRLAQLLDNLVSNAVKFTPNGGRVSVRTLAEDGCAVLEVSDTGMGISEVDKEKLFERFFRTAPATERRIPGTGLGLSIVKAIAEAHGGEVAVESVEGAGTTFRVRLPALSSEGHMNARTPAVGLPGA